MGFMSRTASIFIVGLLAGILLATAGFALAVRYQSSGQGGGSNALVLRLGHGLDENHPVHDGMMHMARRLEELSGGSVRMQVYPNGQLGSEVETTEQVQRGVLDLTKTSTSALEGFVPQMALFGVPYLFDDEAHFWRFVEGEHGRALLLAGESRRLRGLCYYDAGSRSFYTARRPIRRPEDLAGLQVRVQQSQMSMRMVHALGGSATPVPWGELYTALQQGVVDGAENNPPSLYTSRHFEVCKYFSLNEHTRVPDILLISTQTWQRLSPQVQAWVQQAADESVAYQRKLWQEQTEKVLADLETAGVTIERPDKEPFIQRVGSLHEQLADDAVLGPLLRQVREAR